MGDCASQDCEALARSRGRERRSRELTRAVFALHKNIGPNVDLPLPRPDALANGEEPFLEACGAKRVRFEPDRDRIALRQTARNRGARPPAPPMRASLEESIL